MTGRVKHTKDQNDSIDLVFLSHPAYPSSLFSLWWPSNGGDGWKASWWMYLVAPPLSLLIPLIWPWLRNGECMEVAEDIEYSGIRMQNWVLSNFGYQYILWPFRSLVAVPRLEFKGSQVFVFGSPVGGRLDFSEKTKRR